MKTFYAVGDKLCNVPVLVHPDQNRMGKTCTFFPLCPTIHLDAISEELFLNNYNSCEAFTLFECIEDAYKFESQERFAFANRSDEFKLFLIFKVLVEESVLINAVKEQGVTSFKVSPDKITQLVESIVDQRALFGNTKPEFLQSSCTVL